MYASKNGNTDAVKVLKVAEMKMQSNEKGKDGFTALMYAVDAK